MVPEAGASFFTEMLQKGFGFVTTSPSQAPAESDLRHQAPLAQASSTVTPSMNTSSSLVPSGHAPALRASASRPGLPASLVSRLAALAVIVMLGGAGPARAANILWVSDVGVVSATGGIFSGPGTGFTDQGFVTLLQNAGHNVTRFNNADGQAVLLTAAELAAINTNALVIIGRARAAGPFRWEPARAAGRGKARIGMPRSPGRSSA